VIPSGKFWLFNYIEFLIYFIDMFYTLQEVGMG
jgi:hypothetical protein